MHYFTINSPQDHEHLGFFIMIADEETGEPHATQGQFAIKLADTPHPLQAALQTYANDTTLHWQQEQDTVQLYDAQNNHIGSLRQAHLKIGGQSFYLNDLTGVM